MRRYITLGLFTGLAILGTVSTASAQRWGREATPRAGVCFYEDINFQGRYFCSPVGASTSDVPRGMNDRISSVRVFGNAAVTLYRDPNFRGSTEFINNNVADLRGMGFNDRLSSYQVDANGGYYRGNNGNGIGRGPAVRQGAGQQAPYYGNNRISVREAEGIVVRSYRNVLQRDPDSSGLRSYTQQVINNNWTQRDLENVLRQSDEYYNMRGNRARRR
jgi:hypothetical protein